MRKWILSVVLGVVVLSGVGYAQNQSTTYMALVSSAQFLARLQFIMVQQAVVVKAEALNTVCHAERSAYATQVIRNNPPNTIPAAAVMVVGGINITSEMITGSGATADTAATDASVLSQVATFWNALSGCDTGS